MLRSMWLSDWSNDNTLRVEQPSNITVETRLAVYGAIGGFEGSLSLIICFSYFFKKYHKYLAVSFSKI